MTKALVLYSGGLDSRLVVKILKKQGLDVEALYFNLPFGCGCCNLGCNFNFTQKQGVKLTILDVTKGSLFKEYLDVLKNAKHGRGNSYNPCTDCKIFMFKKAKEYADKRGIKVIASGEVIGQRPMSQTKTRKELIDKRIGFDVLRPLSARLIKETVYEKKGLVNRDLFYDISGRSRKKQIELAKKWGIDFPSPAGGCLLCEKVFKKRFEGLFKRDLIKEDTLKLVSVGRHFLINGDWFIVARDAKECAVLDGYEKCLIGKKGRPSVFSMNQDLKLCRILQNAFSSGTDFKNRRDFDEYKL